MSTISTELLENSICPNCWTDFKVADVKWVSGNEDLFGDYRLGEGSQQRFTPTRFDINGFAIDVRGTSCQEIACPSCHLKIPRSVLVFRPFFLSIAGTPSCGKSFYLASLAWQLRKVLPNEFGLHISDSDGECNKILNDYEEQLFFNDGKDNMAKLAKTDVDGDWYNEVLYENQSVRYTKPFYFDVRPAEDHINAENGRKLSRLLCLYDNAGEHFRPGEDTVTNPVTRHLGLAESWIFCFDPTQDPRFRRALAGKTKDHQVTESPVTARQESVLNEMINRIRRHSQMGLKDRSNKPLIVACTKLDAWGELLGELPTPWGKSSRSGKTVLNLSKVEEVSDRLKKILSEHCPEVVAASQSISSQVYFVPVSATGVSPNQKGEIPTDQVDPKWCEVPVLIAMAHRTPKLVFGGKTAKK